MSGIGLEFNKVRNTFAFIVAIIPLDRLWFHICISIRPRRLWLMAGQ